MRKAKNIILLILFFMGVSFSQEDISLIPDIQYEAERLEDPFQAGIRDEERVEEITESHRPEEKKSLPRLEVQGIIWGSEIPQAIINEEIVKVGDMIEGAKIIKIDKEGVRVEFEGKTYLLPSPASIYRESKDRREE